MIKSITSFNEVKTKFLNNELIGEWKLSDDIYHHQDMNLIAYSSSNLKIIHKSIRHFIMPQPKEESPSLKFGRDFHCAILENDTFADRYLIKPKFDLRTKLGKEENEKFNELSKCKILINQDDHDLIMAMKNKLFENEKFKKIFDNCLKEVSYFFHDTFTNELCRIKTDMIDHSNRFIYDLKTTDDCTPQGFSKSIAKYLYDLSAAFYLDGIYNLYRQNEYSFVFIVIEKEPPHHFNFFQLGEESIAAGRILYQQALRKINKYKLENEPSKYLEPDFTILEMPVWALRDNLR